MILVAIDTSTRYAAVGVTNKSGIRICRSWRSNQNHSRELMPASVDCFDELSLVPNQTTHVAVALGPGGFSSVRVGISTALGLITPRRLPVAGVPTHKIEVEPYLAEIDSGTPIYSLIPAGRNEISWSRHHSPEVVAAKKKTFEVAINMGVPPRAEIESADETKEYLDMGVRHFSVGTDITILHGYWKREGEQVVRAIEGE